MMRYLTLFFILITTALHADEVAEFDASGEIINMVLSLGGILVVVFAISFVFKRMMNKRIQVANDSGIIKILERRALNPKCALYVVEVKGKTLVIGESPTGLTALSEISEETDQTKLIPPPKPIGIQKFSFASILKNLKTKVPQ